MDLPDFSIFGAGHRSTGARPLLWQELWRHELHEFAAMDPVVVVPTGAVEQHGPHLPLDVDIVDAQALAVAAANSIDDVPVIVAPPIWTGISHYKMGHIGTISIQMETYIALVSDVCRSIAANGFPRIIVLNGHGGNRSINQAIAIKLAEDDIFLLPITYWDMIQEILDTESQRDLGSIGHAGEWETSLQLYLRRDLVDPSRIAGDDERPDLSPEVSRFAAFAERRREREGGVHGDPTVATREKGERLFWAARDQLVRAIREFHDLPIRHYREFGSHCD
jgi:creatinine amidohydrolase